MPENQPQPHSHEKTVFWIGLFLGGLLGALLIVLLGTEKGKKLAKKLQKEGLDFLDDAKDIVGEKVDIFEEKTKELIHEGKILEKKITEKMGETKGEIRQQVVAKADATLSHIEALQERGRKTTAELRRKLFKNIPKKA